MELRQPHRAVRPHYSGVRLHKLTSLATALSPSERKAARPAEAIMAITARLTGRSRVPRHWADHIGQIDLSKVQFIEYTLTKSENPASDHDHEVGRRGHHRRNPSIRSVRTTRRPGGEAHGKRISMLDDMKSSLEGIHV